MLALALLLAAAPPKDWTVMLHHAEKLTVKSRGTAGADNTAFDAKAKVKILSMKGERPDQVSVEALKKEFPKATVREDSGAPVITFDHDALPPLGAAKPLKRALGRLVVEDPERGPMSTCSAETEAATQRWLKQGVARINGSEPSDVTLSDVSVKCSPTRGGTKLDVAFSAKVPRATMEIVIQCKGTLTVDKAIWVTQWKLEGPVHASTQGSDFAVDGTFESSLSMSR